MIIDCHYHIEKEMFPLEKMIESMNQNGIDKTALIARACTPFFKTSTPKKEKLKDFSRKLMLNCSILGNIAYAKSIKNETFTYFGEKLKIIMAPDNTPVVEAVTKFPDRFLGWIFANPSLAGNELDEVDILQCIPNMLGVKVHPYMHGYNIELIEKLAEYCQEHNLPMLVHLSAQPHCYKYLPEKFPKLKIIYAHAGLPFWGKLWKDMVNYKNVYVDLSSDYISAYLAYLTVKTVGYHKCLYGTDGPYGMPLGGVYDYASMKGLIEHMALNTNQKEAILGGTFSNILSNRL